MNNYSEAESQHHKQLGTFIYHTTVLEKCELEWNADFCDTIEKPSYYRTQTMNGSQQCPLENS